MGTSVERTDIGYVVTQDDDGGPRLNSRIIRTLAPGTYTIEATAFISNRIGSFTLSVQTSAPSAASNFTLQLRVYPPGETLNHRIINEREWGVLDYVNAIMQPSGTSSATYFKIKASQSTGLQVNNADNGQCIWPLPLTTETGWVRATAKTPMMRCNIGSGTSGVEIWARIGQTGAPYLLTTTPVIKQSWHRADHRVDYYVSNPLFPDPIEPTQIFIDGIENTASAWNKVSSKLTVKEKTSRSNADVIIKGYYDPITADRDDTDGISGDDGKCGHSIACTYGSGTYPHLGYGQSFLIENPPHWGNRPPGIWTADYSRLSQHGVRYEYLPATLAHEFGHTFGLGHSKTGDIMSGADRNFSTPCTANCGFSTNDKNGVKGTYDRHSHR